ncbi:DMT family transporter [Neobacillus sp. PS3-12]|jgi:drug/metabolite transporter (DMT)-like permease|uniref:DMT family transporter n=1 Tax=Neobacillus sp. PS3-12 TaxID=3070677 RepID=UPI0027E055BE|nr:DMT family transporter [Neobacillus sp. PS3-12]WML51398.1 DMT family transporter [Neobacillus sp. PS3-12]
MGVTLAIVALLLFSSNTILTKLASARLNMNVGFLISVWVNVLFALVLFLIQMIFIKDEHFQWHTKGFLLFLIAGFFSTFMGRWFFFETIDKLGPARASAFQVSNPMFTTIIAWMFMGEKLSWMDLVSVAFILLGLFLVSFRGQSSVEKEIASSEENLITEPSRGMPVNWLIKSGILLAFLSSLSYAIGNVLRGAAIKDWNEPILGGIFGAALGLVLFTITNKSSHHFLAHVKNSDKKGVLFYAACGIASISAQISVIASMRYMPISIANLITMSTPVIVTPVSFFLFKNQEGISIRTIIGIILVLLGICFIIL